MNNEIIAIMDALTKTYPNPEFIDGAPHCPVCGEACPDQSDPSWRWIEYGYQRQDNLFMEANGPEGPSLVAYADPTRPGSESGDVAWVQCSQGHRMSTDTFDIDWLGGL